MTTGVKPQSIRSRETWADLILITVLWSIAVILVRPVGDFPLNDDWSWGMTAKRLAEGDGYHPTAWTEMTLFTHALWGAAFCLPAGFSFTALRISTLVLSLGGALAMYALIRQLKKPRLLAVIGAMTLAFNPIYFALSNTYMADVPFTTLALLTVLFFIRYFQQGSDKDLWLGTGVAIAATLSRQMGLCLPLAFGIVLWLKHGMQKRWLIRAALPFIACLLVFIVFQLWLKATGKTPANTMRTDRLWAVLADPIRIPINLVYYGWSMLMYLGWFLLPVSLLAILTRPQVDSKPSLLVRIVLLGFVMASVVRFVAVPSWMPVHNNILIPQGIGPATLRDTFDLKLPHLPALSLWFWAPVTLLSLTGAMVLLAKLSRTLVDFFPNRRFTPGNDAGLIGIFLLLCAAIYLTPFLLSGFFDRYLLPVLALLAVFLTIGLEWTELRFPRAQKLTAFILIAIGGIFAIGGTRDYLEWNRTRWLALNSLLSEKKVQPEDIDGGFEFNGWYLYDNSNLRTNWASTVPLVVAFGEIEGFQPVSTNTYTQWMPSHQGRILVLKRQPGY